MPPKRAERAASSPDVLTEAPDPSETIEERHARLTKAVQAQRQLAEIKELERELREGFSPARSRASAGTSPAPGMGAEAAERVMAPSVFRGAFLRELRDF